MGLWAWLFPSDEDRLKRARKLMADGRFEDARAGLIRCHAPEAEALYDECSAAIDKEDRAGLKKQLAAKGFHGWKIEVAVQGAKRRAELEGLIAEELARSSVELDLPEVDQEAVKAAIGRAQRRARRGGRDAGTIKLVPVRAP